MSEEEYPSVEETLDQAEKEQAEEIEQAKKEAERKKNKNVLSIDVLKEKIFNKIKIPDLVKLDPDNQCVCPKKGNTGANRSFTYYEDTETCHCFHGDCLDGDVINYYAGLHDLNYGEAMKELCKEHNIPFEFTQQTEEEIKIQKKVKKVHLEFAEMCHRELTLPTHKELYEEIKRKRGFSKETMQKYKIGIVTKDIQLSFEEDKRFGKEALFEAGFLGKKKHNWVVGERIVYPYFNQRGEPIFFIFGIITKENEITKEDGTKDIEYISSDYSSAKYLKTSVKAIDPDNVKKLIHRKFVKNQLFGLDTLSEKYKHRTLIVGEGITDMISVSQNEYYILSPISLGFVKKETTLLLKYAKRFSKVVCIFDNEDVKKDENGKPKINTKTGEPYKYGEGLRGAIRTAKMFHENGVENVFVGFLPENEKDEDGKVIKVYKIDGKVDINSYLANFPIDKQKERLKEVVDNSIQLIDFLLSELRGDYNEIIKEEKEKNIIKTSAKSKLLTKEIKKIIEAYPKNDPSLSVLKKELKKLFDYDYSDFKEIRKTSENKSKKYSAKNIEIDEEDKEEEEIIQWKQKHVIVVKKNKFGKPRMYLRYKNEDEEGNMYYNDTVFFNGDLELLYETADETSREYTYKIDGKIRYFKPLSKMLRELEPYIQERLGRDALKQYIHTKKQTIDTKKVCKVLGFDFDGWKLPQTEEKLNIRLKMVDGVLREVYFNAKKNIKAYSEEEKKEIKKLMKELIEVTKMKEEYKNIILCWCICSVFRLAFVRRFTLFPHLFLLGERNTGKSSFLEFFGFNFFNIWGSIYGEENLKRNAHLEKFLSVCTFPLCFQEIINLQGETASVLKQHASTNDNAYVRFGNLDVNRKKIAPLCLDSNNITQNAIDNALISKIIAIFFEEEDKISTNPKWITIRDKIKKYSPFSLVYEYTKDWDYDYINREFFEQFENDFQLKKYKKDLERLQSYVVILLLGQHLYKEVFGVDLKISEKMLKIAIESRVKTQRDITNQFIQYIVLSRKLMLGIGEEHERTPNWLYSLHIQKRATSDYFFGQHHLSGFVMFTRRFDLTLGELFKKIYNGMDKKQKKAFTYETVTLDGQQQWCIRIKKEFLEEIR